MNYLQSGTAVAEVGLALNGRYKDKTSGEVVEKAVFVDVTLWGRTAEIAGEYLAKGRPCLIEGRLALDQWNDKESGQKRSKLKVVGETLQLLGGKDSSQQGQRTNPEQVADTASSAFPSGVPSDGNDVPF